MGTDKRARQKANRQVRLAEVEAEQEKETREESTRKYGKIAAIVGGLIALIVLWNVFTGDDEPTTATFITDDESAEEATAVPEIVLLDAVPADFEPWAGQGALAAVEPTARENAYESAPPMSIDQANDYVAIIDTTVGSIRLNLFADEAPLAVNNFVSLARDGFYDGVTFHRVMADFMVQGGDPAGVGTGGPGYTFADEVDTTRVFDMRGILAMANSGPATNGSQFFITNTDTAQPQLTQKHTIFGEIADESPALDRVPVTGEGDTVVINSVRIIEAPSAQG